MLSKIVRSGTTSFRTVRIPPSIFRRVDNSFVEPMYDEYIQKSSKQHKEAAGEFEALRDKIKMSSKARSRPSDSFFKRTHPYQVIKELVDAVKLDQKGGFPLGVDIESELENQIENKASNFHIFREEFNKMPSDLGFNSTEEMIRTMTHAITLRLSPRIKDKVRGVVLDMKLTELINSTKFLEKDSQEKVTVEELTDKLAIRIIYQKLRSIRNDLRTDSSFSRSTLLDFFLRDSYVPQPTPVIINWLIRQVYPLSHFDIAIKNTYSKENWVKDRLQENYFNAKGLAICRFLGLDENRMIDLKEGHQFDLSVLIDRPITESSDDMIVEKSEKNLMIKSLKSILGHREVVKTLDTKIATLEAEMGLYDPNRPVPGKILRQLDIMLHKLPSNIKAKYLSETTEGTSEFKAKYLNKDFTNLELQWRTIDLEIPADIMPVSEYVFHKKTLSHINQLVPKGSYYIERLHDAKKLLMKEQEMGWGDEEELESPSLNDEINKAGYQNVDVSKSKTPSQMDQMMNAIDAKANLKEEGKDVKEEVKEEVEELKMERMKDLIMKQELSFKEKVEKFSIAVKADTKEYENQLLGTSKFEAKEEEVAADDTNIQKRKREKPWEAKERKLAELDQDIKTRDYIAQHKQKEIDVFDERNRRESVLILDVAGEPKIEVCLEQEEEIIPDKKNSDPLSEYKSDNKGERSSFQLMSNKLEEVYSNNIQRHVQSLSESEQKSLALYRQLDRPRYFKHYVAQAYREFYQLNPYDNLHFVDDGINPNLGFLEGGVNDPNKIFSKSLSTNNSNTNLNTRNSKIGAVSPLSAENIDEKQRELKMNFYGKGKRKVSVASAIVISPGSGIVTINNREFIEYFGEENSRFEVLKPLVTADLCCKVDLKLFVYGGGVNSQATACGVAVAKALIKAFPELQQHFYDRYLMWTDNRQVEPKKTGKYKARKSYTYVRR